MTSKPRLMIACLVALVALVALSGCSSLGGTGDLDYISGDGTVAQLKPEDRDDAVAISGDSLEGDPIDLADYRGDVVVVNVWWSGCTPCRTEMPLLVRAAEGLDAEVVGINTRDSDEGPALSFQREFGVTFPSIYDDTGAALLGFGQQFAPRAMPTTAVLDREGRVAAVINGEIPSATTLTELVEEVAAEGGSAGDTGDG